MVSSFVSLPKGLETLSCASFVAGIVQGILDTSGFTTETVRYASLRVFVTCICDVCVCVTPPHGMTHPPQVQAHERDGGAKTIILIRFLPATIARDALVNSGQ